MFFKIFATVVPLLFIVSATFAQFAGPGTTGGGNTTVKQIIDRPIDDMWVSLKGHILSKVTHEKYMFSDGTGQITVEIDDEYFPYNKPITPETTVEISGEVDFEYARLEVDVKQVSIISDAAVALQQGGFKADQPPADTGTQQGTAAK